MERCERLQDTTTGPSAEEYDLDLEQEDELRVLLDQEEDRSVADFNLGTLLMRQGQIDRAIHSLEAAVKARPDYFDALFNGGLCHLYREDKDQALCWFTKAAQLSPEDWQVQYVTGEILLQLGRAIEALPYFKAAYAANPTHFETIQGLAIALLTAGRFEEVVAACDTTIQTHGAATLPLQLKGDAMLALGMYEEAIRCHIDLCRIDLDIRDFIVSRLQTLKKENEQAFASYTAIVHKSYPEFAEFVRPSLSAPEKTCSGCPGKEGQNTIEEAGK